MGQRCCGRLSPMNRWRGRQRRHKAFEFAPKRSWKYKDASLLNQHDEDPNEGALSPGPSMATTTEERSITNTLQENSEEEIDTGEIRRSGLLSFDDHDSNDDDDDDEVGEGFMTTPIHASDPTIAEEGRDRSYSTDSQKIGRFEVTIIGEGEELLSTSATSSNAQETFKLIDHTHNRPQPQAVT